MVRIKKYLPWLIGLVAFAYLATLAVKEYSWVFISSDSGDFLMASTIWAVPQTYGYPLYVLLGHFLNLFPGDLAAKMTVILSALPAAVAVAFIYLVVLKMTSKTAVALISSAVLLGTAVFLTEATVTKGYALIAMFLILAFWSYINDRKYLTMVFLGLGTAVHMVVAAIGLFWLLADRRWMYWLKAIWVYILIGLVPYVLVPILMYLDTPRFLAGNFSVSNLINYWAGTGRTIIGMLSINEAPKRIWMTIRVIIMSFGLALIPLFQKIYKPLSRPIAVLLATTMFALWYVITCLDAQTWTYLALAAPSIAILVGIGLAKMQREHLVAIGASAVILISVNSVFLNANVLNNQNPVGRTYLIELNSLPNGAVVVSEPGPYDLGLFYDIVKGKNLIPLIYPYLEEWQNFGLKGYGQWLNTKYNVDWTSTLDGVQKSLANNVPVFFTPTEGSPITRCFVYRPVDSMIVRITSLTGLQPDTYVKKEIK